MRLKLSSMLMVFSAIVMLAPSAEAMDGMGARTIRRKNREAVEESKAMAGAPAGVAPVAQLQPSAPPVVGFVTPVRGQPQLLAPSPARSPVTPPPPPTPPTQPMGSLDRYSPVDAWVVRKDEREEKPKEKPISLFSPIVPRVRAGDGDEHPIGVGVSPLVAGPLAQPAPAPTNVVRAAAVLGGIAVGVTLWLGWPTNAAPAFADGDPKEDVNVEEPPAERYRYRRASKNTGNLFDAKN